MMTGDGDITEVRRIEVFTGAGRRRTWSPAEKARIVAESLAPGATVCGVARRYGLAPQQLFGWRRQVRADAPSSVMPDFARVEVTPSSLPAIGAGMIEVIVGTIVVRVPAGMDTATVHTVIQAVRAGA